MSVTYTSKSSIYNTKIGPNGLGAQYMYSSLLYDFILQTFQGKKQWVGLKEGLKMLNYLLALCIPGV